MRKLNLSLPETQQVEINGHVFDIMKSDIDILNKSCELTDKYAKIKENDDSAKNMQLIMDGANEITAYIDEILGNGAIAKISRGLPVSIVTACNWLAQICSVAFGSLSDGTDEEHA